MVDVATAGKNLATGGIGLTVGIYVVANTLPGALSTLIAVNVSTAINAIFIASGVIAAVVVIALIGAMAVHALS